VWTPSTSDEGDVQMVSGGSATPHLMVDCSRHAQSFCGTYTSEHLHACGLLELPKLKAVSGCSLSGWLLTIPQFPVPSTQLPKEKKIFPLSCQYPTWLTSMHGADLRRLTHRRSMR
jgi:hypothetical protein